MHERRYQTEWTERMDRWKKKYKRLKTIIYRCQGPLGNHMLCAKLMRFYLVWACVFFRPNHPSLFISFALSCSVFPLVCVYVFFSSSCSFASIPQCSVQWSPVTCENFSHSINTSIAWMANLFAQHSIAHCSLSLVDSAFRYLIFIPADI